MTFLYPKAYDIIVIGGGHAGVEAALAAARMQCQVLLLTMNPDSIGQMSCNPAIGGLGKGHLVREIDALGGEMGMNTDLTGIQFRMLNTKKGPAVQSPRAQCDKKLYQQRMKWVCEREPNLDVKQANTTALVCTDGKVDGVDTSIGVRFSCRAVIVTTGTFLHGLMHVGRSQAQGGRLGDSASTHLSSSLKQLGLELGRLKTGTPPRLLRKSIDFSKMERQVGDDPPPFFSYRDHRLFHVEQAPGITAGSHSNIVAFPTGSALAQIGSQLDCYITFTTEVTAGLIKSNISKSPLYAGSIKGVGPRYCPSIEDKIMRFPDKERHQVFLEPEGIKTDEFYLNGVSTSLPYEIQVEIVRSIPGCESAELLRPAYAIEYDFVLPTQLSVNLETKCCKGLFLAGQINGTSGYEEAAAQGLMAGINAAHFLRNKSPLVLRRDQSYIGVLIDDLVTKGTTEPYRMFTSRAEYRLLLRHDNADQRLSQIGYELGLLSSDDYKLYVDKQRAINEEVVRLKSVRSGTQTLAQLLRRPEVTYDQLPSKNPVLPDEVVRQVEIAIKYQGYIDRQGKDAERLKSLEKKGIPDGMDFLSIRNLKMEARQKLDRIRPKTLGQAARISGVSPADISALAVWLKRSRANSKPLGDDGQSHTSCDCSGEE